MLFTIQAWYDANDDAWHCISPDYPYEDESIEEEDDFVSAFWQEFALCEMSFEKAIEYSRRVECEYIYIDE